MLCSSKPLRAPHVHSPRFACTYPMFVQTSPLSTSFSPRFVCTYPMFVQNSRHPTSCISGCSSKPHFHPSPKFLKKERNWFVSNKKNKKNFRKKPRIGFLPENFFSKIFYPPYSSMVRIHISDVRPSSSSLHGSYPRSSPRFTSDSVRFASMFVRTI